MANWDSYDTEALGTLARAWLADLRDNPNSDSEIQQAVTLLSFSAPHGKQWDFTLAAVAHAQSDEEFASIAAGPLEHILGWHGETYIRLVEERCRLDQKFGRVLTKVWRYKMSDDVWRRVQEIQSRTQ
jgi:hypothetical protein